jgi:predicted ATPase with chaperone activity
MNVKQINKFCNLSEESELLMHQAYDRMELIVRSYDRILFVASTIADLDGI